MRDDGWGCGMVSWDVYRSFFFQAEDGIRDSPVTGVQTCALPIFDIGVTINKAKRGEGTH